MSLKDYIEYLRNQYINKKTNSYTEEYHLPAEYKVFTSKYDVGKWDEINSFNINLSKTHFDSNHEKNFMKLIKFIKSEKKKS